MRKFDRLQHFPQYCVLFQTTKSVLPSMLARGRGHVVGIASTLGLFVLPGVSDYVTSKFSLVGFYESLAVELREQGHRDVGVTCVCPGHTTTDMFKDLTTQYGHMFS